MKEWLKNNAAHLLSTSAIVLTSIGLLFVYLQLKQSNEHQRWINYNQLNLHYSTLYRKMPDELHRSSCKKFSELELEGQRWIRSYFNLYSEEHYLYQQNLIPVEMWTKRVENGVTVNLKHYPVLVEGYRYWKNEGSFKHPTAFIPFVDKKLNGLEKDINQILSKCNQSKSNKALQPTQEPSS